MWTLITLAVGALLWLIVFTVGQGTESSPDATSFHVVRIAAMSLTALALAQLLQQVLSYLFLSKKSSGGAGKSDLIRSVMNGAVYLVAGLLFMRFGLGQDVTSLLATSALFTAILGLAIQPILGHLFSGILIEIERPFRLGDYVRLNSLEGRVVSLSWRSVALETDRNTTLLLPNSEFTSRAVEVIRANKPSSHNITFYMAGHAQPSQVIAVAMGVLRSGLTGIAQSPPPSVIILGTDQVTGAIRYSARFHTTLFLDRSITASLFMERFWYSLHRAGMAMPQHIVLDWANEGLAVLPSLQAQAPMKNSHQDRLRNLATTQLAGVPADVRTALLRHGRLEMFGPQENCGPGLAGLVLSGRLIEDRAPPPEQRTRDLAILRAQVGSAASTESMLMDSQSFDLFVHRSALAIGPLAHPLCLRIAGFTDDFGLAHVLLAESIPDETKRKHFMADIPAERMTRLVAGSWFGLPRLFGLEETAYNCKTAQESALLVFSAITLRKALQAATESELHAFASYLQTRARGCETISESTLSNWAVAEAKRQ